MTVVLQNIVVTLVMIVALAVVLRRIFSSARETDSASCPSCDSGKPCQPAAPRGATAVEPDVRPLVLIRRRR
jgi:hypothetical protein